MSLHCVFCGIVQRLTPAEILYEDGHVMMFVPLNPVTPGHILGIPKDHVADAFEDPYITGKALERCLHIINSGEEPFLHSRSVAYNIITSAGSEATQTVFHLHWHFVPRRLGDGLTLPWTNQKKSA